MSDKPFVPFYTSDFLAGTSGMTAATKGVYITILCLIYEKEEPIGQSWETLARRCGCTLPAFKKAIEFLVDDGKIEVNGAQIWSEKCEKHIALRCDRRNSARSAAKKRWEKTQQNQRKGDASASSPQCKPKPEPEPNNTTLLDARAMCEALGVTDETKSPGLLSLSDPIRWIQNGCDIEMDILPTLRRMAASGRKITSWAYCSNAVFEARDRRLAPAPKITAPISKPTFSKPKSVASLAIENAMRSSNG